MNICNCIDIVKEDDYHNSSFFNIISPLSISQTRLNDWFMNNIILSLFYF